ncbi:alpha/beta hydrolase [Polaromonas sp. SM01]|uniref:alpha/beta hydrolase n=1 Tax=Polaromonas sp. SM01 TaxID=3085630 RepID=UPI002981B407|nr:alpha/beta hydrolase [Polaromonas sp. SM01]MDW5441021.1 alpha/beta hydrolase [Polaromonas sp. SM01]
MLPALLTACSGVDLLNATVPTDSYRRTEGLAYGPYLRQRLDVYRPTQEATRAPLVVFFYGGSWSSGERGDYRFVGEALASQGIVTVVADYRLSPDVRYPAFVQDSARAVHWALDHAAEHGADPARVFVMGHSAGAYNAAMVALDPRWLRAERLLPTRLAGWIGLAGPYDFLPIGDRQTRVAFDWPGTPADSQPLSHASAASPPALLLAAAEDRVVNPQRNTVALAKRLRGSGVRVDSELFDSVGHVTLLAAMASVLRSRAPVLERVSAFVQSAPSAG